MALIGAWISNNGRGEIAPSTPDPSLSQPFKRANLNSTHNANPTYQRRGRRPPPVDQSHFAKTPPASVAQAGRRSLCSRSGNLPGFCPIFSLRGVERAHAASIHYQASVASERTALFRNSDQPPGCASQHEVSPARAGASAIKGGPIAAEKGHKSHKRASALTASLEEPQAQRCASLYPIPTQPLSVGMDTLLDAVS